MKIAIAGMHCQSCIDRVKKALEKLEGAQVGQVRVGSAELAIDPTMEALALEAIRKIGYEPSKAA